jgi:hypothetical protein
MAAEGAAVIRRALPFIVGDRKYRRHGEFEGISD